MYYKQIDNNIIISIGTSSAISRNQIEISESEYNSLMEAIRNKPEDTLEAIYRLSAETNRYEAFTRTHDETVEWYVQKVTSGEIPIDEVPEDYKAEVEAQIPTEPSNPYGIDDTTYSNIIDDYTSSITSEVASNGY